MTNLSLLTLLNSPEKNRDKIVEFFKQEILPLAVENINKVFSPRRLSKQSRLIEPLAIQQRQLSSYRTRLGTMLEYGLSTEIEKILINLYGAELFFTFAVAHEFPDFYLRNKIREPILKIEMKAVDADSDEQAARFDVLTEELNDFRDFILFIGWKWETETSKNVEFEYPKIFAWAFVSAIEIAKERDRRLFEIGGKIENGVILVPSTKAKGTFVSDPGNYGKLWRIVQKKRRNDENLSSCIKEFVIFLSMVDQLSPRTRIKKPNDKE